ncbi:SIR2 family NAD-dependent protein deacylase [Chachezhania sediminis]|uniref:SIR2 family NAD-dependent protein deacylase n=1 Tax=Chachezhania sediminis TaxID=2599291 RepID=UPI00131A6AC9|nr:SIR2 family protein [Chachezhania sediminis]
MARRIKSFGEKVAQEFDGEALAFSSIRPHCVVTTNYDELLENLLEGYQPVIGRGLITAPFANIGEVYKIHGTIGKPSSIVLTAEDYTDFNKRRKYQSAKLLTFFAEHPILFVGYSISDPNIQGILSDLAEAFDLSGSLVKNMFIISRPEAGSPSAERLIQVSPDRSVRLQSIETNDFSWAFEAFSHNAPLQNVNPQVLRAILARSYHLVRKDIPKQLFEVDFDLISEKTKSGEEFAKLFGIADLQSATGFSAKYCHNLTAVAKQLGYSNWHRANLLIKQINDETGIDIKASDNRYHCTVRISKKSKAQMYSDEAVDLLKLVRDGLQYEVEVDSADKD